MIQIACGITKFRLLHQWRLGCGVTNTHGNQVIIRPTFLHSQQIMELSYVLQALPTDLCFNMKESTACTADAESSLASIGF